MTTTSPAEQPRPVTMEEAVGYPAITCTHETLAEHTVVLKHDRLFLLVNQHGSARKIPSEDRPGRLHGPGHHLETLRMFA